MGEINEGGYSESFYSGADYGFDPDYGKEFSLGISPEYRPSAGQFGLTTDPRSSAQLQAVSNKLSTGAKVIEVSGVSPAEFESVPEQHLAEMNRLRKLVGVDLTFHGPLVEPTGLTRQGWDEPQREQAERQMWLALKRSHQLDPKGNVVVTFHSSNGLPDPESRIKDEKTGKEQITDIWIANEADGTFQQSPVKPNYFAGEKMPDSPEEQIKRINEIINKKNKDTWFSDLFNISYHASQGSNIVEAVLSGKKMDMEQIDGDKKKILLKAYKDYLDGGEISKGIEKLEEPYKELFREHISELVHGDTYLRDAYQRLQDKFNQAYEVALKNNAKKDIERLEAFRAEIAPKIKKDIEDPEKLPEFGDLITQGVNVLRSVGPPKTLKPLREFGIDKSSDTFSGIAFRAYKEFKDTAPIISIENPPVGMGLARAQDLKDLVKESRRKLQNKLIADAGFSEEEARKQAEKLIGVTWDVGHINMLRKYGYTDEDIVQETKKVAPLVKHVHLSDNFGMEHTELPMGMGNVPTKAMLEAIAKFNKQAKKIIETGGNWYRDFKISPLKETLRAFGSPIYSMQLAPNWINYANTSEGYFVGYGRVLPEQHFSTYGAGFSNLPPELGGQMGGRSRMGGAPIE